MADVRTRACARREAMSERPVAVVVVGVGPGLGFALVQALRQGGHGGRHGGAQPGESGAAAARRSRSRARRLTPAMRPTIGSVGSPVRGGRSRISARPQPRGLQRRRLRAGRHARDRNRREFERCWRVGCFAGFLVGQAAAKRMLATGRGTIIFTGATAALRGATNFANLAVLQVRPARARPGHGARAQAQKASTSAT